MIYRPYRFDLWTAVGYRREYKQMMLAIHYQKWLRWFAFSQSWLEWEDWE